MADTESSGIELSDRPAHPPVHRLQTGIVVETPSEGKTHDHSAGKLPPEAPAPMAPFKLHVQTLKNLVSGGLDMKNKADYDALVHPLMDRCGGSIEKLAANINAPLSGGLQEAEGAKERQEAFGINRLPEKEMVCHFCPLCFCWNGDVFPAAFLSIVFLYAFLFIHPRLTLFEGLFLGAVLERS
jgi:hypothetical protein